MRIKLVFRYIFMVLTLSLMVYIFVMSSQPAAVSTQSSGKVIRTIAKIVVEDFESAPIDYQLYFINTLQFFIRKAAHFVLYFFLGFSVCGCALTFEKRTIGYKALISFGISVLYAISDEIHQLFIEGRSGQFSDVLLDGFGILCGILFINFLLILVQRFFQRRDKSER